MTYNKIYIFWKDKIDYKKIIPSTKENLIIVPNK
jgi:hypothetical protein